MPDWQQIVSSHLGQLRLFPEERGEVVAELASHLEDCHRDLSAAGTPDPLQYTLAQVPDWDALGRRIRKSKEGPMSYRRQVTLPGIAALLFSGLWEFLVLRTAYMWWRQGGGTEFPAQLITAMWVLTFVLAGALGAALARHAGAAFRRRLLAAIYPSFQLPAIFVPVWIATLLGRHLARGEGPGVVVPLLVWAGATAACALGALPWLLGGPQAQPTQPPRAAGA